MLGSNSAPLRAWRRNSGVHISPLSALRDLLPESGLNMRDRAILTWLVLTARADPWLCWPPHRNLGALVGCSKNAIGPALERLAILDHVSIFERPRRVSIVLVHPGGVTPFITAQSVHDHLRKSSFAHRDVDAVIGWLIGLNKLESDAQRDDLSVPAVGTAAKSAVSPQQGQPCPRSRDSAVPTAGTERSYTDQKKIKALDRTPDRFAGTVVPIPVDRPDPADFRRLIEGLLPRANAARREVR